MRQVSRKKSIRDYIASENCNHLILEGFFQVGDGDFLAIAQAQLLGGQVIRIQWRDMV
jgi:hypothetical protein